MEELIDLRPELTGSDVIQLFLAGGCAAFLGPGACTSNEERDGTIATLWDVLGNDPDALVIASNEMA